MFVWFTTQNNELLYIYITVFNIKGGKQMNDMNRKLIGNRIKDLRKKKHLTQFQLAELIDVSTVYVSYIENGKRQLSLDNLINIANVLEVTCDDILVLNQNKHAYHSDMEDLLKDCNNNEKKILVNFIQTVKDNLSFQMNTK